MVQGSASFLHFTNSAGKDRIKKIHDPLYCNGGILPVGYISDGASIPRAFWSIIGHPFNSRWIREAAWHDIRCEFKVGTWQNTHEEFLDNLADNHVHKLRRNLMFGAVWSFGPKWKRHESITIDDLNEIVRTRTWGNYDK